MRFFCSAANTEKKLLLELEAELKLLDSQGKLTNTLLIHPDVLNDFLLYNEFLNQVDRTIKNLGLEGVYQVASFHPHYQFADTDSAAVENYTNRSPYPMLHILSEDAVEQAIKSHPDVAQIPERNMRKLKELGLEDVRSRLDKV